MLDSTPPSPSKTGLGWSGVWCGGLGVFNHHPTTPLPLPVPLVILGHTYLEVIQFTSFFINEGTEAWWGNDPGSPADSTVLRLVPTRL